MVFSKLFGYNSKTKENLEKCFQQITIYSHFPTFWFRVRKNGIIVFTALPRLIIVKNKRNTPVKSTRYFLCH